MTDSERRERQPESPDVAARAVLFVALALVGFIGCAIGGARIYYLWEVKEPLHAAPKQFAAPRLQIDDAADLARFEQQARAQLDGYAWIDRERGIIRIPIERAIALIAAKGAEGYGPIEGSAPAENAGGKSAP